MLSGAISWVGKQAQLSANPVILGEGWWLITQAITKGCNTHEGLDIPAPFHLQQHSSTSAIKTHLHDQQASQQLLHDGRCLDMAPGQCTKYEVRHHSKVKFEAGGSESYGQPPSLSPSPSLDHGFKSD